MRRRGIDSGVDRRVAMRRLVDEAVVEYDAVAGYGPLQRHLDDLTVEVWIKERLPGCSVAT